MLTASGTLENKYDYPYTNLLTSSVMTIYDKYNNMRRDTISNLTYDDFGRVMHNSRGGTVADMTYSHDKMHGWLMGIRSGGSFEQLLYRETEGCSPCYNGNISAMTWRTGNDYVRRFDYGYDSMNRLIRADYSYYSIGNPSSLSPTLSLVPYVGMENEDYSSQYGYDKNGNLLWAYRQGLVDGLEYGQGYYYDTMDDYNVTYAGNRKTAVNGTGCGTPAFYGSSSFVDGVEDGTDEYAYNTNGAMTKDLNKGITNISYDLLGNLQQITMTGNRSISYVYAADGTRLRTVHSRKVGGTYVLYELEKSQNIFYIGETKGDANSFDSKNRIIRWNPYKGLRTFGNDYNMFFLSPTTRLNHEAGHALSFEKDPEAYKLNSNKLISSSDETYTVEEAKTINGIERKTAIAFGEIGENEITREDHTGYPFTTDSPISNIPLEQIDEVEINSSQSSQRKRCVICVNII